ncbi:leishmanolysin-related zinc metalloendopeptidase [Gemmatirosa kalamazoonensis]|nr:leishmanolysin-related zinc metalloendopeptidase [Gemmatirosa kalamazoonensis]
MSSAFPRRRASSVVALVVACAALLGACHTDGPPAVARVVVSGVADTITVGDTRSLVAALSDANGSPITGRGVSWTSSDNAVATVDGAGALTALAPGRTTVTATSEGRTGQLVVNVRRRPVASLVADRLADTVWLARTQTLRAQPRDANGTALSDRVVTWSSPDSAVLSVATATDGSVLLRGTALGSARLVAQSEGVTTTITVAVVPVPVAKLTLAAPDTVLVGRTVTLRASAIAPDGTPLASADLAGRSVTWSTDRAGVISVAGLPDDAGRSPSGYTATARGVGTGNATVSVRIDGAEARYTMIAARLPVARLSFPSATIALGVGDSRTITMSALDLDGNAVFGAPIAYSLGGTAGAVRVTPGTAADGSPTLTLDGLATGTATVNAEVDGRTALLAVTVTTAGTTFRAFPTTITAAPGAVGRLSASLVDGSGTPVVTGPVSWRSTNAAVVTVDASGRATMVAPGTASLVATSGGSLTASVAVTVAKAPVGSYHIEIVPVGVVSQAVIDAATQAAHRWERVITTALPAEIVQMSANECDVGTSQIQRLTDGLIVYLMVQPIDGSRGTLAYAGPCAVREARYGGLPIVGSMTVDKADVSLLTGSTGALALDVLTHELGHVLGIGTMWDADGPMGNLIRDPAADIRFIGAAASAATVRLGLTTDAAAGVPVEDEGGMGTAGGHWRERVFLGELMTGWINDAPNPLSVVTVQALRDIGYQVTETGADIVSPSSIVGGAAAFSRVPLPGALTAPLQIGERLLKPRYVIGKGGTRRLGPQARQ